MTVLALAASAGLAAGCSLPERPWFHRNGHCCENGCCDMCGPMCDGPMLGEYGPVIAAPPVMNGSTLTAPTPYPVQPTPIPSTVTPIRPVPQAQPQPQPSAQPQAFNPIR
jgi:hypothetical protein